MIYLVLRAIPVSDGLFFKVYVFFNCIVTVSDCVSLAGQ